jgi:hypothetical protein
MGLRVAECSDNIKHIKHFSFWISNSILRNMEGSITDTALLIIEAEGVLITILMGILGYFYVQDKRNTSKLIQKQEDMTNRRIDKQDETIGQLVKFMKEQQKQITDISNKMNKTVELIGNNQENDREQMGFLKDLVLQAVKK